jgi:hypothetical protein
MSEELTIDRTIHDHILIKDMKHSETVLQSGIVLRSDSGVSHGVRPRWAEVFMVGPEQKHVSPGNWILLEHGRWSRKILIETTEGPLELQRADENGILLISDTEPPLSDQYIKSNC